MIKRENLDPKLTKMEFSVRAIGHLLYSFEADYGKDELNKFMDSTGLPVEYFYNENNWVSFNYFLNLLNLMVEYSGDKQLAYKYGLNITKFANSWGIIKTLVTLIPIPMYMYRSLLLVQPRISKVGKYKIEVLKKNKIRLESTLLNNYKQTRNNCLTMKAQLSALPTYCGFPLADVKEIQCAAEGKNSCIYEITWQDKPINVKKILYPALTVIASVLAVFAIIKSNLISPKILSSITLILLPIALYFFGRLFDYKRTIKDNTEVADEQNKTVLDSLEKAQTINEELQQTVDQRTEELKASNKKLAETIIALKENEDKLVLAERMAGIGQLAAGVAHEVNNPMGAVRNYLQDILEDLPEDDKRINELKEAEKATLECKNLIIDLLSFARTDENLHVVDININDIINNILYRMKDGFNNYNISVKTALSSDLPIIYSDSMQMNQVFSNIILNAYKAVKENGEISIETSSSVDGVHVEIRDNGEIITPDLIDKIFDPLAKKYYGIGRKDLELAIAYNIVKRFDGEMIVTSSSESGTVFNVLIPYGLPRRSRDNF